MWIRLLADFDWRQPGYTVAYLAGETYNVPRAAADEAIAAGKAARLKPPRKGEVADEEA